MKPSTCAALAFTSLFATTAMAAPVTLTGCTQDGKSVNFDVDATGTYASPGPNPVAKPVADLFQQVFADTAKGMIGVMFASPEGGAAFSTNLDRALAGKALSEDAFLRPLDKAIKFVGTCTPK